MELNYEELAKAEVARQVKEKINSKLHLVVQKELKNYEYQSMIKSHLKNELKALLVSEDVTKFIDFEQLHKDIVKSVSEKLMDKLTYDIEY